MPSVTDWISAVASSLGVIVAGGALWAIAGVRKQIALQRKQLKLDLENVYVARYWAIMDDLDDTSPDSDKRRVHIGRYLRLSEDQCDLRARKRITESTWNYWRSGIAEQLTTVEFQQELDAQRADLFDHVRRLSADSSYDPAQRA